MSISFENPMRVPLASLEPWNPFKNLVWHMDLDEPITMDEVKEAVDDNDLYDLPIGLSQNFFDPTIREDHIRRIAYFVVHGWCDDIFLDVGIPRLGCYVDWIVQDGNHRLAAAFYRGDETILASICGDIDFAMERLGLK